MKENNKDISETSAEILYSLRKSVKKAIEKKKKLGQYYVIWDGEKPVKIGPDAPKD